MCTCAIYIYITTSIPVSPISLSLSLSLSLAISISLSLSIYLSLISVSISISISISNISTSISIHLKLAGRGLLLQSWRSSGVRNLQQPHAIANKESTFSGQQNDFQRPSLHCFQSCCQNTMQGKVLLGPNSLTMFHYRWNLGPQNLSKGQTCSVLINSNLTKCAPCLSP